MPLPYMTKIRTDGSGLWSTRATAVDTVSLEVTASRCDGELWGELRVYFNTDSRDVSEDGSIYTDGGFQDELRDKLRMIGLPGEDAGYSEQGMQGDNYVSLDVGREFIEAWEKLGHAVEGDQAE